MEIKQWSGLDKNNRVTNFVTLYENDYLDLMSRFDSAINTLRDIADMGRKAGSESARHRLRELGIDCPDYESMT